MAEDAKKKVIVWKFKNPLARHNKDFTQAVRMGEAQSHQELVDLSGGGYLGYTDPETHEWLSYAEAEKRFGEQPWVNMQ